MRRWLSIGLIIAVVVSLFAGILGHGVASAKSPKPQDQVKNFMSAAAGLKAAKAASYWVSEEGSNVTSKLTGVVSGTKISLSKLQIMVITQTEDAAVLNATYSIKIKAKGKASVNKNNEQASFMLSKINGKWLIESSDIWDKEYWNAPAATPIPSSTPTKTVAATQTPTKYTRVLSETRVEYYDYKAGYWVPNLPPALGPADKYEIKIGSAKYSNNLDIPNSMINAITMFMTWSAPPETWTEGDTLTLTAKGWGQIDIQRQSNPAIGDVELSVYANPGGFNNYQANKVLLDPSTDKALTGQTQTFTWKTPLNDPTEYDIEETAYIGHYGMHITYVYLRLDIQAAPELEPLIFIPGVTGSQLAGADGHVLWPPEGCGATRGFSNRADIRNDFVRLSLNPKTGPHEAVKATDVIRTDGKDLYYGPLLDYLVNNGGYVEYQVNGDPARRTSAGFDLSQKDKKPNLFVFAYDWRLSNVDNAKLLADYVAGINKMYPGKKVNIVAHSMGGIISRRFIIDNPGKVNKLTTVATPFLGSPKSIYQMIYGTTGVTFTDDKTWLLFGNELKEMLAYFPGVHELMPSRMYFALGGRPYHVMGTGDLSATVIDYIPLMGTDGIIEKLFKLPSYNGKTPAQSNRDFHSYTNGGNNQDDWSNDTTGVKYCHIVGIQQSGDTPLILQESYPQSPAVPEWHFVQNGAGDGTVPRLSAERIGSDSRSLNAPGAQIVLFTDGDDKLLEHTGLVTNPAVQSKILEVLQSK